MVIFVVIFGIEKIAELLRAFCNVILRYVGVNVTHGGVVGPATNFHCGFLRNVEMVCQRGEAVTEAVVADFWQPVVSANPIYSVFDCADFHGHHISAGFRCSLKGIQQRWDDWDGSGGGLCLVLLPVL